MLTPLFISWKDNGKYTIQVSSATGINYLRTIMFSVIMIIAVFVLFIPAIERGGAFILIIVPFFLYIFSYLLLKLINKTSLVIIDSEIIIINHPIPVKKKQSIQIQLIGKLDILTKRYQGRSQRDYYQLVAYLKNGTDVILLDFIDEHNTLSLVKNELDNQLNL